MGAFAGLLRQAGHRVTGSDTAFYPPMGDALKRWGIETRTGFDPANLEPAPGLVVIGNVCRPTNPEARAAIDRGLPYMSFPAALHAMLALASASNLWPIILIFTAPLGFLYLIALFGTWFFTRPG